MAMKCTHNTTEEILRVDAPDGYTYSQEKCTGECGKRFLVKSKDGIVIKIMEPKIWHEVCKSKEERSL